MRIATSTLFGISTRGLQKHSVDQARLQQQLSTGKRILSPSDDPIASARVLDINQTASITKQYSTNIDSVNSSLGIMESTLSQIVGVIQDVQTLAVNAGNPSLTSSEKQMLDSELKGRYEELLGLANGTDGSGIYLFSGYQGDSKPFTQSTFGNVSYNGDEGVRKVQIASGREIPTSENGSDLFQRIKNGNGTFTTAASASNTGSGIVSTGEVLKPAAWSTAPANGVTVQFYWEANASDPAKPIITYDLIDATGTSVIDGATAPQTRGPRAWTAGGDIELKQTAEDATSITNNPRVGAALPTAWDFGGKLSVSGTPVAVDATTKVPTGTPGAADSFTVTSSNNVDLFSTLGTFSSALSNYLADGSGAGQAEFQNQLNTVMQSLNNALTNTLTIQASVGARMKEAESVQDTNGDLQLQYQSTLSTLESLDYAAALSDFSMNQMLLDATRKSFAQVQDMSLFKYI